MEDKDPFIPHNLYDSCWWPGDAKNYGIRCRGINLIPKEYSYHNMWSVNPEKEGTISIDTLHCYIVYVIITDDIYYTMFTYYSFSVVQISGNKNQIQITLLQNMGS